MRMRCLSAMIYIALGCVSSAFDGKDAMARNISSLRGWRPGNFISRQLHNKTRATAGIAILDPDMASVRPNDALRNGQSHTRSSSLPTIPFAQRPEKLIEDAFAQLR